MGTMHDTSESMASLLINYYSTLFTTSQPDQIDEVVAQVSRFVTGDMNKALIREIIAPEVELALKQ
jgi:protein involved in ribonucleotide reduction